MMIMNVDNVYLFRVEIWSVFIIIKRTLGIFLLLFSEYEVISKTRGPHGEEVSILTTNQTHTAVENLKPESRYVTQNCC